VIALDLSRLDFAEVIRIHPFGFLLPTSAIAKYASAFADLRFFDRQHESSHDGGSV